MYQVTYNGTHYRTFNTIEEIKASEFLWPHYMELLIQDWYVNMSAGDVWEIHHID